MRSAADGQEALAGQCSEVIPERAAPFRRTHALRARVDHVAGPRRSVRGPFVGGNLAMLAALVKELTQNADGFPALPLSRRSRGG